MQTFLPYPSFIESARCLDNKRLGNQRREVLSILTALTDPTVGWQNHPAVKMWRGYGSALIDYGLTICIWWKIRGYKDTCYSKILKSIGKFPDQLYNPPWLGDEDFHSSHRAALLAKDPEWYGQFGWSEEPKIEYIWPV